ncbi:MAG TPA: 23S rRNA (uracil(1939)-C(5))-methyltransferase RlmD, partial [Lachnospiraceae bacterium]|nr:23S rRNA (uracil(1939)-C(5))-methyltransferase RlmD [Lachnospiraceae bacterium]
MEEIRYKKNDTVKLEITDLTAEGMGVGKIDGYALFVKDAVVGDVIDARIVKTKKNYGYARIERIVSPSAMRIPARCILARRCGGCQIQEMDPKGQLDFKQNKVRNNLIRIGGFDPAFIDEVMEPIIGMEDPWRYRNKAQYPIGTDKDGNPVAGFYAGRTHNIIPCTDCALAPSENSTILGIILEHMRRHDILPYDE